MCQLHGRFKSPALWHMGMRDRSGDARSPIAPCRAVPSPCGTQAPHCWKMLSSCTLGFLGLEKQSTRHPFSSIEGAGPQNLPVTGAGFCRGRTLVPRDVHSSTPSLSSGTRKCTELSPAKAATLADLLHLPSYVAIGTTAPASAPAAPCHAASAPHWAQPTSALLPAWSCLPLTHQLPASSSFLGDNQITAVAINYCISYNLLIHLSLPFPPTLE